jgi:hypothetical protein
MKAYSITATVGFFVMLNLKIFGIDRPITEGWVFGYMGFQLVVQLSAVSRGVFWFFAMSFDSGLQLSA